MQNSIQWCNLYSAESKYNIAINPSKTRQNIIRGCLALSIVLFLSLSGKMYHYILSDFTIVFLVIICLLVGSNIIFWCFPNYIKNRKIKQFVLYENGLIDFEFQSSFKLHANSRIGWFGCWLVLANESSEVYAPTPKKPDIHLKSVIEDIKSRKPIKMFFFKDSLSELDYSRLSRQILSNHR